MSGSLRKVLRSIALIVVIFTATAALSILSPSGLVGKAQAQKTQDFTDIDSSPYRESILALKNLGITNGTDTGKFSPTKTLNKAEAATLIQRAFRLVEVKPMVYSANPDLEKKVIYESGLQTINEAFLVPSAKDIPSSWACFSIEGVLSARIDKVQRKEYGPQEPVSEKVFCAMLAKAIYGPDKEIDHLAKAVAEGFIPQNAANSDAILTREKAAHLLAGIVTKPGFQIVTFFVTSDIHGNLVPYKPSGSNVKIGSLAKISNIVKEFRAKYPGALLLDCGDSPYNTNIANLFEGASTVEVMSKMGYDATALGNHDFDYSFDILRRNALAANYAFLSANTYMKDGTYPSFLKPYIIKEINGVRVGIVGLTDDTTKIYTHYMNTKDIDFHDHFEVAAKVIPAVDAETDVLIALAHLHGNNKYLPEKVQGIDVEVGGGNDIVGPPSIIGNTWFINPGKYSEALNQVNMNILNKQMIGANVSQVFMSEHLPDDPDITAVTNKYQSQLDAKMQSVIGKTAVALDGERGTVRCKESNLGNVIADSQRLYMEADIAFQNGGGIRASKPASDLTLGDIYAMLPFDNKVMMLEVTGKTVWDILENAISNYPAADGRFLQVSGISFTFDASKPKGQRIVSIKKDDKDLALDQKYKIVVNDFMAGGGDGYSMINVLGENPVSDVKILAQTNYFMRDVFREYIQKAGTISPSVEGRITILNPAQ